MFVRDYMSSSVLTVTRDTGVQEALRLLRQHKIRRLPVVDADGKMVGIVTERDLLYASASPATSLSVWELNYLLARLKVEAIMAKQVINVLPQTTLQEAARLMLVNKVGGLPVIDQNNGEQENEDQKNRLVGIITESDIFRAFIDLNPQ